MSAAEKGAPRLYHRKDWPTWFSQYQFECNARGVWGYGNPDAPGKGYHLSGETPNPLTFEDYRKQLAKDRKKNFEKAMKDWDRLADREKLTTPKPTEDDEPSMEQLMKQYDYCLRYNAQIMAMWQSKSKEYTNMFKWIENTVDPVTVQTARAKLGNDNNYSLQSLARYLKDHFAPDPGSVNDDIRGTYNKVLQEAIAGRINPHEWLAKWRSAKLQADAQNTEEIMVPEVHGTLAVREFYRAVSKHFAPEWERERLRDLITDELQGNFHDDLEEAAKIFAAVMDDQGTSAHGVFTTIAGNDSEKAPATSETAPHRHNQSSHRCPCGRSHPWKPVYCSHVQYAMTGLKNKRVKRKDIPKLSRVKEIRDAVYSEEFKEARQDMQNIGWRFVAYETFTNADGQQQGGAQAGGTQAGGAQAGGAQMGGAQGGAQGQGRRVPRTFNAAIIDPSFFEPPDIGIYAFNVHSRHPLSDCTLMDSCGATHVVNDESLLEHGTFRPARVGDVVDSGTTSLPIKGFGTRVLKKALDGDDGPNTVDLTLTNVALIEGFHVNIISEARLKDAGIWFCGFDTTLRYGRMDDNVVLKQCERRFNLVFFEYKPFSSYSQVPVIPTSMAGVLAYPTIKRRLRNTHRRTREFKKPRSDSAQLWHDRAGHLGPKALEALVWSARNVKIKGIPRVNCEHCATTHAKAVISRRPRARPSPRPFWRVTWDLFDFPVGYDGSNWALVVKDEYSGKIWVYVLTEKTNAAVFGALREFERWTKRQYNLAICILKHDNDTSVIGINGYTPYEDWARAEGIDLELSPPETHEPNGGAERAGQEMITKSIKMRIQAGLPEGMWVEAVLAAAYLYNMSPLEAKDFRSPNEVLDSWFTQYFRFYDPAIIAKINTDLRPDWNGIYSYGCRAYPVIRDYEAKRDRRGFKVRPRGHIGYLVGYQASNIYRIWVPQLRKVMITRNVTFDERLHYSKELDREAGQPIEITRRVVEYLEEEEGIWDAGSMLENLDFEDYEAHELGGGEVNVGASSGKKKANPGQE